MLHFKKHKDIMQPEQQFTPQTTNPGVPLAQMPLTPTQQIDPTTGLPAQPTTQAQPQQTQALFSTELYYFPEGKHTLFGAKKGMAYVYPGTLIISDATTNQEMKRWPLQGTKVKNSFGMSKIKEVNGQKVSMRDSTAVFYFYNPLLIALSYWFMLAGNKKSKAFTEALKQAGAV